MSCDCNCRPSFFRDVLAPSGVFLFGVGTGAFLVAATVLVVAVEWAVLGPQP